LADGLSKFAKELANAVLDGEAVVPSNTLRELVAAQIQSKLREGSSAQTESADMTADVENTVEASEADAAPSPTAEPETEVDPATNSATDTSSAFTFSKPQHASEEYSGAIFDFYQLPVSLILL
jgi:hypothetical protein